MSDAGGKTNPGLRRGRSTTGGWWLREAANAARLDTRNIVRLGIPDRFIEHAERGELLADLGLDVPGICATVRKALGRETPVANGVVVAR